MLQFASAAITYRTILQSWIVYKKHYGLLLSPPIPSVDRSKLKLGEEQGGGEYQQLQQSAAQPQAWRGPRTGNILRSIHGGEPMFCLGYFWRAPYLKFPPWGCRPATAKTLWWLLSQMEWMCVPQGVRMLIKCICLLYSELQTPLSHMLNSASSPQGRRRRLPCSLQRGMQPWSLGWIAPSCWQRDSILPGH